MQSSLSNQQLTKRERRGKRREESKERQKMAQGNMARKRMIKWALALLILGVVIYGLFLFISRTTTSRPGQSFAIQGREHISVGDSHPEYNSNPPTSGSHYGQTVNWGVYQDELPDESVIHNLEHGGIWISYQPSIDEAIIEKINEVGRKYPGSVVVAPRAANDSLIALASWGRLEKLSSFDEQLIIEFIKKNKNKSPERLAR